MIAAPLKPAGNDLRFSAGNKRNQETVSGNWHLVVGNKRGAGPSGLIRKDEFYLLLDLAAVQCTSSIGVDWIFEVAAADRVFD